MYTERQSTKNSKKNQPKILRKEKTQNEILHKFYIKQHKHYCGIDLHARSIYLCILDSKGQVKLHKDIKTSPEALMRAIKPYLDDLIIAVECMFSWYWVADFCENNNIKFILGHALYMKAIHGGKVRNDKVDSHKIASLVRGGTFPMAFVYPRDMRDTRDLLKRRMHLMRKRSFEMGIL